MHEFTLVLVLLLLDVLQRISLLPLVSIHHILLIWCAWKARVETLSVLVVGFVLLIVVLRPHLWLHRRKILNLSLDTIIIQDLLKISMILLGHLVILLFGIFNWLFFCVVNVDCFIWTVKWPMIVFLVVDEIIYEHNVPKIDKTVRFICLFWIVIVVLIWRQLKIIKMIFVILFKIILDFIVCISARNVLYHKSCSCFFTAEDLVKLNWSTIVTTHVWGVEVIALLWVWILSFITFHQNIIQLYHSSVAAISMASNRT